VLFIAGQSKECTVFSCLVTRVMGLNNTWNMDVYVCSSVFMLSSVGSGLRQADSSAVSNACKLIYKSKNWEALCFIGVYGTLKHKEKEEEEEREEK